MFITPRGTTESSGEVAHCLLHVGTLLRAVEMMLTVYYTSGNYWEQSRKCSLFLTLFITPLDTNESSGEDAHYLLLLGTILRAVEKTLIVYYTLLRKLLRAVEKMLNVYCTFGTLLRAVEKLLTVYYILGHYWEKRRICSICITPLETTESSVEAAILYYSGDTTESSWEDAHCLLHLMTLLSAVMEILTVFTPQDTIESPEEDAHCLLHVGILVRAVEKIVNVYYSSGHYWEQLRSFYCLLHLGHYIEQWRRCSLFITSWDTTDSKSLKIFNNLIIDGLTSVIKKTPYH